MDNSKDRAIWLAAGICLLGLLVSAWLIVKVQRAVAPAPDNAPVVQQNASGLPELEQEEMITGLSNVWDVGFLPDKTLIFTEREGTISKLAAGKKQVIFTVPSLVARGEGGLLGLAVDPKFDSNRYIYACYNTAQDIRISRWRVNENVTGLTNQTDIVTGLPVNVSSGRHSGCRTRFGADGNLWIGTGDTAEGSKPQNPKSLGGKVLRVTRDGKPVAGNLETPFDPRIFSYGHRNVQGLAMLESADGDVYGLSLEHGPDRNDEVNLLRAGNKGWDPVPGYNESVPMTDKSKYPDALEAIWESGDSTIAPSGAAIITGSKWQSLNGRLAVAVLKNKHVRLLQFDDNWKLKSEEVLFKEQYGRIRSVVIGPEDNMYLTTDNGNGLDKIIEISPR